MDTDAPHPHCPFCGLPMQFKGIGAQSTLQTFDCNWCGVALNISPQVEVLEIAASAFGRG
jgi:transposase-like protein